MKGMGGKLREVIKILYTCDVCLDTFSDFKAGSQSSDQSAFLTRE